MTDYINLIHTLQYSVDGGYATAAEADSLIAIRAMQAEIERLTYAYEEARAFNVLHHGVIERRTKQRDAALARLAEIEAQNLMARQIILEHGRGVVGASPTVQPSQAGLSDADVWANEEIMALNAEAGLEMSLLMKIVRAAINAKAEQPSQAGLSNLNNCQYCDHSKNPQGGHCYMFREAPTEICQKHTLGGVSTAINSKGDK